MVEGVVRVVRLRKAVARLEVGEAVEGRPHCPCDVNLLVVGEFVGGQGPTEDGDDLVDGPLEFGVAGTGIAVCCGIEAGMVADHLPPCASDGPYRLVARDTDGGGSETVGKDLAATQAEESDHGVEAVDVPVEGRLAHAQFVGNTGEGHCIEALAVSQGC